jgi:hypothetical protein
MTGKMTPGEQLSLYREMVSSGELARTAPKRAPAKRRTKKNPDQLEILDPAEAARRERLYAQRLAYQERRKACPDGRELPDDMTWCGRCGEIIFNYSLVINHDLGYCGCPVEFDPVLKLNPGPGFRHGVPFSIDELNNRWDRQFFPDCECGDACGIHDVNGFCIAYCGCHEYRPKGE